MCLQVLGTRDAHSFGSADTPRPQRAVLQKADANGKIDALFDEIDETVADLQIQGDPRIAIQE